MQHTILADANSLGYFYHSGPRLTVGDVEIQSLFGMVKNARVLKDANPTSSIIYLWDGHAQWRYDLLPKTDEHPGYKGDRDKNPKDALSRAKYKAQKPLIEEALGYLGMTQITASTHEADDLAGYFVKKLQGHRIKLITGDRDWLQLVDKDVVWYDPIREVLISEHNFFDKTGYFTSFEFLQGKCLQGDTSDKIPGVGGIGEKGAPIFMAEHRNVADFFKNAESGAFKTKSKVLNEFATENGKRAFVRNFRLMSLKNVPAPRKEDMLIVRKQFNKEAFKDFCERYAFRSILANFNSFVEPFEKE